MRRISTFLLICASCAHVQAQSNATTPVVNLTSGSLHETINDALNAAQPADHLQLAQYQFVEHVAINMPITLSGSADGTSVIDVSQEDGWGITLSSDNITLEDITVVSGGVNTAYAIHSEPGISGLTLDGVSVFNSHRTCIDLNGLAGPHTNTLKDITVSGSSIGFGIAMSACANVLIENINSIDNGFGDIAIMESNYSNQEIHDIVFVGDLNLEGPQSLGGGGVIVQISPSEVPVGSGPGFPISMNAPGFDYLLEAPGGDLTGCILVHSDDVRQIAQTLGANIAPLVSYDMATQHMVVFPGMSVQSAVNAATDGATVIVEAGTYDDAPIMVSSNITLQGANAGIAATENRSSESIINGFVVTGGAPVIDGFRVLAANSGHGIEVQSGATGANILNSLLIGSDSDGGYGIVSRENVTVENVKVSGFAEAIRQWSGQFNLIESQLLQNGLGLSVHHDLSTEGTTQILNSQLENTGGPGIVLHSSDAADSFTMEGTTMNLHTTAFSMEGEAQWSIADNTFTNSELQVSGLSHNAKLLLCASNAFSPALRISGCTDPSASNYEACATLAVGCTYLGCTSPKACNFDANANTDDGSCDFSTCAACPLGFACNYDPEADLYKVEACEFVSCEGQGMAGTDGSRGGMMSIAGCTIPQACNYDANADNDDGSCTFDCYGCQDDLACNFDAAFTQAANATCLYAGDLHISTFVDCNGDCLTDANANGVCDEEEVSGCTDDEACNFSGTATLDDGGCEYSSCAGCTNPASCNFDSEALISDGSCDYESCAGCTDADACNFSPGSSVDDGSCQYPVDLHNKPYVNCDAVCLNDADGDGICDEEEELGCTDAGACNYDAVATDDDGSCEFNSCAGCTDSDFCNFNPGATIDNGTCAAPEDLYPDAILDGSSTVDCLGRCLNDEDGDGICDEFEVVCPGDLNGDGLRGAADILVMLSAFGCTGTCGEPDLNNDGFVGASDILMALSTFGLACP